MTLTPLPVEAEPREQEARRWALALLLGGCRRSTNGSRNKRLLALDKSPRSASSPLLVGAEVVPGSGGAA